MTELLDRADKYAAGKANAIIDKAIAQAYVDGYRDGYKDKENEIPVDFRGIMTEFIDLGLPSGTLWSCDFEKEKENDHRKRKEKGTRLPKNRAIHFGKKPKKAHFFA